MLDQGQIARYHDEGYLFPFRAFSAEMAEAILPTSTAGATRSACSR